MSKFSLLQLQEVPALIPHLNDTDLSDAITKGDKLRVDLTELVFCLRTEANRRQAKQK